MRVLAWALLGALIISWAEQTQTIKKLQDQAKNQKTPWTGSEKPDEQYCWYCAERRTTGHAPDCDWTRSP